MIITICGSVAFSDQIIEAKNFLEQKGHQVNIPSWTQRILDGELTKEQLAEEKQQHGDIKRRQAESVDLIRRYWDYIKGSDAILVLNLKKKGIEGYIGGSTLMEMGFAYGHQKTIYLHSPPPERSERMHYVDEILAMKPIIIHGDLTKIVPTGRTEHQNN